MLTSESPRPSSDFEHPEVSQPSPNVHVQNNLHKKFTSKSNFNPKTCISKIEIRNTLPQVDIK